MNAGLNEGTHCVVHPIGEILAVYFRLQIYWARFYYGIGGWMGGWVVGWMNPPPSLNGFECG